MVCASHWKAKNEKFGSVELVGVLKRRAGFMSAWRPFKFAKKGAALLEYRLQADIKKENPLRCIRLKNAMVYGTDVGGKESTFCIFTPHDNRTYFLQAINEEEKMEWLKCLGSATSELAKVESGRNSPVSPSPSYTFLEEADLCPSSGESQIDQALLQMIDKTTEAMLILSEGLVIVAANPAACHVLSCSPEDVVNLPVDELFPEYLKLTGSTKHSIKLKVKTFQTSKLPAVAVSVSLGHLSRGYSVLRLAESSSSKFSLSRFSSDRRISSLF